MRFKPGGTTAAISLAALTACCGDALAADVPVPRDTVATRVRAELRPPGLRAGAFEIFPSFATGFDRNDNIYADNRDTVSDTITTIEPRVDLRSTWSRHALEAGAAAKLGRYADNDTENYDDIQAYATGRVSLSDNQSLTLTGRLGSLHENRFSPDDRDGLRPVRFRRAQSVASYQRGVGRVTLKLEASLGRLDYLDAPGAEGSINHDDRDRDLGDVAIQVDYDLSPGTTLFVKGSAGRIDYDDAVDDGGFARSSDNQQFAIGANVDLAGRTSVSGFVGRVRRDFEDERFDDIDAAWFSGVVTYRLSGLTTLTAQLSRDVGDTVQNGASGIVSTTYTAGIDHELLRNLILKLKVARQKIDFDGISRRDDVADTRFEMQYMVNRHFEVRLGYRDLDRDVEGGPATNQSFRVSNITLDLQGKL